MSQTNTNTNNGHNQNQNSGRSGRGQRGPAAEAAAIAATIAETINHNICIWRENENSPISKLLITKTGYRSTQYKEITNTLPVFAQIRTIEVSMLSFGTEIDRVKTDLIPTYPDATWCTNTHHVEIVTVNPNVAADANTSLRPPIVTLL